MTSYSPTIEDLRDIAEQVWSSYLDPDGASPLITVEPSAPGGEVSAAVSVTGPWRGHIVINLSTDASSRAAAALLGIELDEVTPADVSDAVGELVNIIGGNVKGLVAEPSALSLPHVLLGDPAAVRWPSATEVCQLSATWCDEPITVSVLECTTDFIGVKS
jgi:chemotaxis protein CheX